MIRKSSSKKSIAIKICGLTKTSQARSIAELKINAIGVIGVKNSPRFVPEEECMKIFNEVEKVSSTIEKVLVIANAKLEEVKCINNRSTPPSVIQLHGNESVDYCRELKNEFPTIKLWKAFRLKSINDLKIISQYEKDVDAILLKVWTLGASNLVFFNEGGMEYGCLLPFAILRNNQRPSGALVLGCQPRKKHEKT